VQAVIEGDATRKEVAEALTAGQIEAAERIQGITEVAAAKRLVAGMQVDAAMTIQAGIEGREARLFAIEEATPRIQMIAARERFMAHRVRHAEIDEEVGAMEVASRYAGKEDASACTDESKERFVSALGILKDEAVAVDRKAVDVLEECKSLLLAEAVALFDALVAAADGRGITKGLARQDLIRLEAGDYKTFHMMTTVAQGQGGGGMSALKKGQEEVMVTRVGFEAYFRHGMEGHEGRKGGRGAAWAESRLVRMRSRFERTSRMNAASFKVQQADETAIEAERMASLLHDEAREAQRGGGTMESIVELTLQAKGQDDCAQRHRDQTTMAREMHLRELLREAGSLFDCIVENEGDCMSQSEVAKAQGGVDGMGLELIDVEGKGLISRDAWVGYWQAKRDHVEASSPTPGEGEAWVMDALREFRFQLERKGPVCHALSVLQQAEAEANRVYATLASTEGNALIAAKAGDRNTAKRLSIDAEARGRLAKRVAEAAEEARSVYKGMLMEEDGRVLPSQDDATSTLQAAMVGRLARSDVQVARGRMEIQAACRVQGMLTGARVRQDTAHQTRSESQASTDRIIALFRGKGGRIQA